jgi:CRISPR-associated protein Csb1
VKVVILDSYQSQANRVERTLLANATDLGLPQIVLETEVDGCKIRVSSLDAPHRSRDAYFLDSTIDGTRFDDADIGKALNNATLDDATAFLRYAPYDLIFGVWDSHRGKRIALKFPRSYTSEIVGWDALGGKRGATKGDPLNLPSKTEVSLKKWRPDMATAQAKKDKDKLSRLGHGMIPGEVEGNAGGVSVKRIAREAIISLTGLARFSFANDAGEDASVEGRTLLAALALLGDRLTFGGAGISLRSGCDLVLKSQRVEWVGAGANPEGVDLSEADARELLATAQERLLKRGVSWSSDPVVVVPSSELQEAIEQTFFVPELEPEQ